ncbi:hypothetical protein [Halocola ammonii]
MELETLENWIDKNVKWVFAAVSLIILVYFGSLFWGYAVISFGFISYVQLAITGAAGGLIVSLVKPHRSYRFFFLFGAGLATLLVYFIGQWIGYVHFIEHREGILKAGALVSSHAILTDFNVGDWLAFLKDSNNYLGLEEVLAIVFMFYVVQYVGSKGRKQKPGDHNYHTERKSRFKRRFDR